MVRHISEDLWIHIIYPIVLGPAWAALGVLGVVLTALSFVRRGRRPRRLFRRS